MSSAVTSVLSRRGIQAHCFRELCIRRQQELQHRLHVVERGLRRYIRTEWSRHESYRVRLVLMPRANVVRLLSAPMMPHDVIDAVIARGRYERELPREQVCTLVEFDPESNIRDLPEVRPLLEPQRCTCNGVLATEITRRLCLGIDVARQVQTDA